MADDLTDLFAQQVGRKVVAQTVEGGAQGFGRRRQGFVMAAVGDDRAAVVERFRIDRVAQDPAQVVDAVAVACRDADGAFGKCETGCFVDLLYTVSSVWSGRSGKSGLWVSAAESALGTAGADFRPVCPDEGLPPDTGTAGCDASIRRMMICARSMLDMVRAIPICSRVSFVLRMPAVSRNRKTIPSMLARSSMMSRVVPAMSETMARSSLSRRLSKVLFRRLALRRWLRRLPP